jgi:Zn-dependent M28 family amino/carboxypeptidase
MSRARESSSADAGRLEARVRRLVEDYSPRDLYHPENLAGAAGWIAGQFERAGARVSGQPFAVEGQSYRNVIGSFGPETEEVVVVGAHYDASGHTPGADDNASGVAGLLELADIFSGIKLGRRVELVAYALEEMPFVRGSAVHARSLRKSCFRVRGMLCLEMIGYFRDEPGSQELPPEVGRLPGADRGNFIALVGDRPRFVERVENAMKSGGELPVYSTTVPFDLSDHVSYREAGFPAVMITDTAFFRNPNYHRQTDTPDTLDYERMAEVANGAFRAVTDLVRDQGSFT